MTTAIDKDELFNIDTKTLASIIVTRGYLQDILVSLIQPFGDAVLQATSPDTTILHKNRYDAVVAFGNELLNRLNDDADMTPPPAEQVQLDS